MDYRRRPKALTALLTLASAAALSLGIACSQSAGTSGSAPAQPEPTAARSPSSPAPQATAQPSSSKAYVCPMECEVADHPGKCSKCGMDLKEVDRAAIHYVCPVCGASADRQGACPKDHTILVLKLTETPS